MKCACDRCEKVTVIGSDEYKEWRRIEVYKPWIPEDLPVNRERVHMGDILLCDQCYDTFLDFKNNALYRADAGQAQERN